MSLHEFCKYGRRFRWLIVLYVSWIVLTTYLIATHQAFVSSSEGLRLFAMQLERNVIPVGLVILGVILVALWSEDSIWDTKAFWKTRPISTRDQLMAKALWLGLLGGLLPGLAGSFTTFTAQMGGAESIAFGCRQGLYFLALGSFASLLTFSSKNWQEIAVFKRKKRSLASSERSAPEFPASAGWVRSAP